MDEADKMNEAEDVWMKAKPLRIGFGALSPRVLVLPFPHSFPPLRFSLSLAASPHFAGEGIERGRT